MGYLSVGKPLDFEWVRDVDDGARHIANTWQRWDDARGPWKEQKKEIRNYVFATDTSTTTNSKLPWKNSVTIPKLCQIRDNLHANYMAALFPHEEWLQWEGATEEDSEENKRRVVEAYMKTKLLEQGFETLVSQYVYDYIDYGNVIGDTIWENNFKVLEDGGEVVTNYVGPRATRISPFDHVFDPTVANYRDAPKITRYLKTLGQLQSDAENKPELGYSAEVVKKSIDNRMRLKNVGREDAPKDEAFQVDGFGSLWEYFQSNLVEVLEFEGDYFDEKKGTLVSDRIITVIDRSWVVRDVQQPSWLGESTKQFVGWRLRPDNLWAMGPLDNLVGMQYRMDHIENAKDDAWDQFIIPTKVIKGYVEDFSDMPGERIIAGDDGDVSFLRPPMNEILANSQEIRNYSDLMELMAGAPREAMGIRSPGEKTAFEVQELATAAGRIFQSKIQYFEKEFLEPLINKMFEQAKRNLDVADVARVVGNELGVVEFINVTKEDLTVKGKFRPIGARHFAEQAKVLQELTTFANTPLGQDPTVNVHLSGKKIASMVTKLMNLEKYNLYRPNVRIFEQQETQQLINAAQDNVDRDAITPTEEEV